MEATNLGRIARRATTLRWAVPFALASACTCLLLIASRGWTNSPLGVPEWWTWVLTIFNLLALWLMSRGHLGGWVIAASLQPPTVVFCLLTGQRGFVVGSLISVVIHLSGCRRSARKSAA